jgi:ribosomal-protein-alanine N-acetyltransferase
MTPVLETARLVLRPIEMGDVEQIQALFPQWEIVRYLANVVPWPYPADGALTHYRDVALPAIERGELWAWNLRLKNAPDKIIGSISLQKNDDNNRGFWILPEFRRQGLMTEAVNAVTDLWFDVLGFPVLRLPKAAENAGSRRISEKCGMRIVATEERDYVSGRYFTEVWEITAAEWRQGRAE